MRPTLKKATLLVVAALSVMACSPKTKTVEGDVRAEDIIVKAEHPRILLGRGGERQIRQKIESEPFLSEVHSSILDQSEGFLSAEPLQRIKTGKRLLAVSRSALKQIFYLSYSYRMTGDVRFARKAEQVMRDVCSFTDWNPTHFLDVAEMTMAVSIGYDWLYDEISDQTKEIVRTAILQKGINPSLEDNDSYNNWQRKKNNWNAVCNSGMAFGAIAVYEDYPELSRQIIARSINSSRANTLQEYGPDGNYPEGYMYWNYGTAFLVMLDSVLESATTARLGLEDDYAFMRSGEYMAQMTTQDFGCFAYSDCDISENTLCIPLFWFASKSSDPSILYGEACKIKYLQSIGEAESLCIMRYLPCALIWAQKNCFAEHQPPKSTLFVGQGPTPVAIMRNHWGGDDEIFLGFKTGSCSAGHAHMDIGSFVMYRGTTQWAYDLGKQDYYSLEKYGLTLFDKAQYGDRWKPFRCGMYSHNIVTFSDSLQRVKAYVPIEKYGEDDGYKYAAADLTSLQGGLIERHERGCAILDDQSVVVRDEIVNGDERQVPLRWAMLTSAQVEILDPSTVRLTQDGKSLYMVVESTHDFTLSEFSTAPIHEYDEPNPGTTMVGFTATLSKGEQTAFSVKLIPQEVYDVASREREIKPIEQW